jgi:hypothetical protein
MIDEVIERLIRGSPPGLQSELQAKWYRFA